MDTRPIRVTRVIALLEPGGAQLSALRLARGLLGHGVEARVLAGEATAAGLALAARHGIEVEVHRRREGRAWGNSLQWEPSEAFAEWLEPRLRDADVVHAHMFGAWWAAGRAMRSGTKLVASEHNALNWPRASRDAEVRAGLAHIDLMYAHGPLAREQLLRLGIARDLLRPGISSIEWPRRRSRANLASPRVTYAGRFWPDKGPDILIRALAQLVGPPTTYMLGDGGLRPQMELLAAELGVGRAIRFPGWQQQPEGWVAGALAHVVPSREEAWSQSAVLAMALGVPVIGSAVEGLPDTLGEGRGILVASEDPEALAETIAGVLSGAMRPNLAAARRYARGFKPATVADAYAGAYRDLLRARRKAASEPAVPARAPGLTLGTQAKVRLTETA